MSPAPTPTPRTDYASLHSDAFDSPKKAREFARQLERELAEAKLTEAVLRSSIYNRDDDCACIPEDCSVTEYVAFLRSQAERLAGALAKIDSHFQLHPNANGGGMVVFSQNGAFADVMEARKELAAWKEGK